MKRFVAFAVLATICGIGTVGCDDPTVPDDQIPEVVADKDAQRAGMQRMIEQREKASGKPAGVKVDDLVK